MEKMEKYHASAGLSRSPQYANAALLLGTILSFFLSAKWTFAAAAWLAPACFLFYVATAKGRAKWFWLFAALLLTNIVNNLGVVPMPLPILLIIMAVGSVVSLLIIAFYDWISRRQGHHFFTTLIFPAVWVAWEYYNALGDAGVWGVMANTQYGFSYIAQLASATGVWGISFVVYWFNSVVVWAIQQRILGKNSQRPLFIFGAVMSVVLLYGVHRYHFVVPTEPQRTLKAAGIAPSQFEGMGVLYEEVTGKTINLSPTLSQSSPELQAFNQAFVQVLENPDSVKYPRYFQSIHQSNAELFQQTQTAADAGSRMVMWAEGSSLIFPQHEKALLEKAQTVATNQQIYLLVAYAVLYPGKVVFGKKIMENKAVFISPKGVVLNTFFKNRPVPFAESSVAGDGKVPTIATEWGNAAISICYDADFPNLMRQLSDNKADFLLLPSGDWHAIAPHHSYMAAFRGIENGCGIVRSVKNGLSVATDFRGEIHASSDFFTRTSPIWTFEMPVGRVSTWYSKVGDVVAYGSFLIVLGSFLWTLRQFLRERRLKKMKI